MSRLLIGVRIKRILEDEALGGVPEGLNMWPRIQQAGTATRVPAGGRVSSRPSIFSWLTKYPRGSALRRGITRFATVIAISLLVLTVVPYMAGRANPVSASALLRKAAEAGTFVAPGKVRHMIIRVTDDVTGEAGGLTTEVWLANGKEHLLLWKPALTSPTGQSISGTFPELINDDGLYQFHLDTNTVYKVPYNPDYYSLKEILPDRAVIDKMLASPGTHIAGTGTLDGRAVVIVEGHVGSFVAGTPREIAEGTAKGYETAQHDYSLWIDNKTYQIVQEQHYITWVADGANGRRNTTSTKRITLDETLDAGAVQSDLFTLKLPAGAKLVDVAAQVSSAPPPEMHNDWYEFPPDAKFSVLMPRTPEESVTMNTATAQTVQMYGVKQGPIAYDLKYTDYPQDLIDKEGVQAWLDNERDYIAASVPGRLIDERQISLDSHPGRELKIRADDGKYRICRIYLVDNRFYNIYVIMPDEKSVTVAIERYLDSLKLLK